MQIHTASEAAKHNFHLAKFYLHHASGLRCRAFDMACRNGDEDCLRFLDVAMQVRNTRNSSRDPLVIKSMKYRRAARAKAGAL